MASVWDGFTRELMGNTLDVFGETVTVIPPEGEPYTVDAILDTEVDPVAFGESGMVERTIKTLELPVGDSVLEPGTKIQREEGGRYLIDEPPNIRDQVAKYVLKEDHGTSNQ